MPTHSAVLQDVTTINYALEWPQLENPSNTTFAGLKQIDICRCGPLNTDLGHIYTRYRCRHPEVRFAGPDEQLWVLQAPLGQVNLLRPANIEELQRRKEIHEAAEPSTYAGKNFLLLSGPCPRGRYQAFATLSFLKSLSPAARQHVESLSLLIQPYEEDCAINEGGHAYVDLARYIIEELPNFKTLCLNIWGEETKAGSRELAMVLWKEGVSITVNWDWWSGATEEYTDVEAFLKGIDEGVVKQRPVWENQGGEGHEHLEHDDEDESDGAPSSQQRSIAHELLARIGRQRDTVGWEELSRHSDDNSLTADQDDTASEEQKLAHDEGHHDEKHHDEATEFDSEDYGLEQESVIDATTSPIDPASSEDDEDDWSDAMMTPLSPTTGEHGSWQIL